MKWAGTTLIAVVLTMLAGSCTEETPPSMRGAERSSEPDQILRDTRMVLSEYGNTSAIIEANTVKIYEDSSYASLEDSVVIFFYNKKGEQTTKLTAMTGEIWGLYENTDSLKAAGDVVVRSEENNAYLEAPAIRWIVSVGRVFGEGLVRLNSENGFEQGTGFEAKDDLSEYEFKGPVSGEVHGEDVKLIDR